MADLPQPPAQPAMTRKHGGGGAATAGVIIDNRTNLPDAEVRQAIEAHWVETAAMQFGHPSSFQMYATNPNGSMLSRSPFRTPTNVIEEIKLARSVVDTDDDIAAVVGQSIATAFGDGMQNLHEDERTIALFNKVCGPQAAGGMNMDMVLKEMYREYLIAASVTTLSLFTRTRYNFTPNGGGQSIQEQLATPVVGVLPAENIRVTSNDLFGNGELAYDCTDAILKEWLDKFFDPRTTAAVKNQMRQEQPVLAAVFTGRIQVPWNDQDMFTQGKTLYTLNNRMVHRTTMPKGASAYPRPPLTANFALLEAKRLLNIMDYALLQGGTNYIVIAKQGSDQLPAQQPEIDNLVDQVRSASRTGVLVGDHRLSVDIITPELKELLNPDKRKLIGRKLAMALLRIPEQVTHDSGNAGAGQELEFTARSITADRRDIKRHVEGTVYEEIVARNKSVFSKGTPSLWFPKIVLSGVKDFFDSVIKARDRGDIPRKYAVELLGFDYESGVAQRKREKDNGDDEVMTPGNVPFNGAGGNPPGDLAPGGGRPPGSSPSNGRPGGAPGGNIDPSQRQRALPPGVGAVGEAVASRWDEGVSRVVRYGEVTAELLESHPDYTQGRVTRVEQAAVETGEVQQEAASIVIPVNLSYETAGELRVFRLADGLGVVCGQRQVDGAIVARALSFREPQFNLQSAEEAAIRWGFITSLYHHPDPQLPAPVEPPPAPATAEEIAAALTTTVAHAAAGLNVPALLQQFQTMMAETVAQAVAQAIAAQPPAPPAPAE